VVRFESDQFNFRNVWDLIIEWVVAYGTWRKCTAFKIGLFVNTFEYAIIIVLHFIL